MLKIEWDESLGVGVTEIDEQHRRFIDAVNELYTAILTGGLEDVREARGKALERVDRYIREHFASEEAFMEKIGYPGLPGHRELHESFAARIDRYRKDLESGDLVLSSDIIKDLLKWFRDHLADEDRRYADFYSKLPDDPP